LASILLLLGGDEKTALSEEKYSGGPTMASSYEFLETCFEIEEYDQHAKKR
jgi:hypothetical protein